MFKVKKRTLLLIAGIVWLIAGFNVARLGVLSYLVIERQWFMYLLSVVVFVAFGMMFLKMSVKHTRRILGYEDRRPFWHFFDLKAYIIMACMMGGGIGLREAGSRSIPRCLCGIFLYRTWLCAGIGRNIFYRKFHKIR